MSSAAPPLRHVRPQIPPMGRRSSVTMPVKSLSNRWAIKIKCTTLMKNHNISSLPPSPLWPLNIPTLWQIASSLAEKLWPGATNEKSQGKLKQFCLVLIILTSFPLYCGSVKLLACVCILGKRKVSAEYGCLRGVLTFWRKTGNTHKPTNKHTQILIHLVIIYITASLKCCN